MKDKIYNMLNEQIQKEFESAYAYLDIAAFFDSLALSVFSRWYKIQAEEEEKHAMRIYDYIYESGHMVKLLPLSTLKDKPKSILGALNLALTHEEEITGMINTINSTASREEDYATQNFLVWFMAEQREEESSARKMIEDYKMFGGSSEGLYLLNEKLMKRKGEC